MIDEQRKDAQESFILFMILMQTEKGLIYHKRIGWSIYSFYSIVNDNQIMYILDYDWKQQHSGDITREQFEQLTIGYHQKHRKTNKK